MHKWHPTDECKMINTKDAEKFIILCNTKKKNNFKEQIYILPVLTLSLRKYGINNAPLSMPVILE